MIVEKQSEITVLEDTEEQQQSFDMTVDLEEVETVSCFRKNEGFQAGGSC